MSCEHFSLGNHRRYSKLQQLLPTATGIVNVANVFNLLAVNDLMTFKLLGKYLPEVPNAAT